MKSPRSKSLKANSPTKKTPKKTPAKKAPKKKVPKKAPTPKPKATASAAKLRPPEDVIVRAAAKWAQEAPIAEVRRLAEASRGSWLDVEVPFQPNYLPPAHGLSRVIFGAEEYELAAEGDVESFWEAVLGGDAELIDDPAATHRFADRVREIYRERAHAAKWGG